MLFEKISKIYFSPSNTTKKVTDKIAENFEGTYEIYDLLNYAKDGEPREFGDEDIVIVGMPVFAGRIPDIARQKLEKFKTKSKTPAIAFVNIGNANTGDSLLELTDILKNNGFNIVGAAVFVSQHSIFNSVAKGRPDEKDLEKIKEFSEKCKANIESGEKYNIKVPGNKPYKEYTVVPFKAGCDEMHCIFCYDCVSACPQGAIPNEDPVETDTEKCDGCTACIYICPENARSFINEGFEKAEADFAERFSKRKEPEFYF
ncbi:MAG: 4Fe-4S binding protein [Methanobrevibacter sp.]|nr:4Fe-4S binding protein [Methanobrevibacter sp.]